MQKNKRRMQEEWTRMFTKVIRIHLLFQFHSILYPWKLKCKACRNALNIDEVFGEDAFWDIEYNSANASRFAHAKQYSVHYIVFWHHYIWHVYVPKKHVLQSASHYA